MSNPVEDLQNLASKIDDIKEKISDEEYKDLLELAHKYYDQEKNKSPKKIVEIMKVTCISLCSTTGHESLEQDDIEIVEDEGHFFPEEGGDPKEFKVHVKNCLHEEKKILEVVNLKPYEEGFKMDTMINVDTFELLKDCKFFNRSLRELWIYISHKDI